MKFNERWNLIEEKGQPEKTGNYFVILSIETGSWMNREHAVEINCSYFDGEEWNTNRHVVGWQKPDLYYEYNKKEYDRIKREFEERSIKNEA